MSIKRREGVAPGTVVRGRPHANTVTCTGCGNAGLRVKPNAKGDQVAVCPKCKTVTVLRKL